MEVCYNDFMRVFGGSKTVRTSIVFLVIALLTASAPWAMASGARGSRRSDTHVSGQTPSVANSNRRKDFTERHSQGIPGFQRRRPSRIIVVPSPAYYYSPYYFVPAPSVVNASFFCLEHGVGFISRVGFLDHLGGTHKFALEHAAAICPPDVETCVFEGVWALY
jgi:hypothetical protein